VKLLRRLSPLSAALVAFVVAAALFFGVRPALSAGRATAKTVANVMADPDPGAQLDEHSYLEMVNQLKTLEARARVLEKRIASLERKTRGK
jgi:ubiquinone biosynthesis protein UbiJ